MKKLLPLSLLALTVMFHGCTNKVKNDLPYVVNKTQNMNTILRTFDTHKTDKAHSAIAVALDTIGRYVIGYAYDAKSQESAKVIALQNCEKANIKASIKSETTCKVYVLDNTTIRVLK